MIAENKKKWDLRKGAVLVCYPAKRREQFWLGMLLEDWNISEFKDDSNDQTKDIIFLKPQKKRGDPVLFEEENQGSVANGAVMMQRFDITIETTEENKIFAWVSRQQIDDIQDTLKSHNQKLKDKQKLTYDVERILYKGVLGGVVHYFVKWEEYGEDDNTWVPASAFHNYSEDMFDVPENQELLNRNYQLLNKTKRQMIKEDLGKKNEKEIQSLMRLTSVQLRNRVLFPKLRLERSTRMSSKGNKKKRRRIGNKQKGKEREQEQEVEQVEEEECIQWGRKEVEEEEEEEHVEEEEYMQWGREEQEEEEEEEEQEQEEQEQEEQEGQEEEQGEIQEEKTEVEEHLKEVPASPLRGDRSLSADDVTRGMRANQLQRFTSVVLKKYYQQETGEAAPRVNKSKLIKSIIGLWAEETTKANKRKISQEGPKVQKRRKTISSGTEVEHRRSKRISDRSSESEGESMSEVSDYSDGGTRRVRRIAKRRRTMASGVDKLLEKAASEVEGTPTRRKTRRSSSRTSRK